MKKRIHMHLDTDIFKTFKDFCNKKQINFSNKIEELMNKELTSSNQKPSLLKYSEQPPKFERFELAQPISYIGQQINEKVQITQPKTTITISNQAIQTKPSGSVNLQPKKVPTIDQLRYRKGL